MLGLLLYCCTRTRTFVGIDSVMFCSTYQNLKPASDENNLFGKQKRFLLDCYLVRVRRRKIYFMLRFDFRSPSQNLKLDAAHSS